MRPNTSQISPSLSFGPWSALRTATLGALLTAVLTSGCVYRINIQQGNFLDPKAVEQLANGMTRSQVRFLLGTPLVSATFDTDRWDYVYYLKRGHSRKIEQRKVTVYFVDDKVERIERPEGTDKRVVDTAIDGAPRL